MARKDDDFVMVSEKKSKGKIMVDCKMKLNT